MIQVSRIVSIPLLIVLLIYPSIMYAQISSGHRAQIDTRNITALDSTVGPQCKKENGVLNGTCRTFWPNGEIKTEGLYKNNFISGVFRSWYKEGELKEEWNLDADNMNGFKVLFWPNGNTQRQTFLEGGVITEQKHWSENEVFILHELVLDSTRIYRTSYRPNGVIEDSGTIENGQKSGQWSFYNERGELSRIEEYIDGKSFPD